MDKDIQEQLKEISSKISMLSDEELTVMGSETFALVEMFHATIGGKHSMTKHMEELLNIFRAEYIKRHPNMLDKKTVEKPVEKVTMKVPDTCNQLLCLGDGSVN